MKIAVHVAIVPAASPLSAGSGGFKGVTRKLRNSLGFGDKDKDQTEAKHPPDLATHVSFNDRVEEVPVPGGAQ